jgi:hypothetical protein
MMTPDASSALFSLVALSKAINPGSFMPQIAAVLRSQKRRSDAPTVGNRLIFGAALWPPALPEGR